MYNLPFTCLDICFGIFKERDKLINAFIMYGKQFIFETNVKTQVHVYIFLSLKSEIIYLEKVENLIAFRKNKLLVHILEWEKLFSPHIDTCYFYCNYTNLILFIFMQMVLFPEFL